MEHLFCGIQYPRHFERVRVDNVNFSSNSSVLKERVKEILTTKDEITLVYCGNVLEDDEPINKYNLQAGSTIHVLRKIIEKSPKEFTSKFTEIDVGRVCALYRGLNSGNFHKISRPEVLKEIFGRHPELQNDLASLAFVKDPILLSNLQNPDTVRKMAENHRVLIEASETICKALRTIKTPAAADQQNPIPIPNQNFDDLSDSSSSSGSEANSPQASTSAGRRITNDFLRRSLAAIVQQNQNSLANISQRNLSSQDASNAISPSSSSSSVPGGRRPPIISSSMFMNAMNEVLRARRSETNVFGRDGDVPMHSSSSSSLVDTQEPSQQPQQQPAEEEERQSAEPERMEEDESARDARDIEMIASFQMQLKQMEDMGLSNKAANIQALMVCNGNLEAAVNLVLAEMNMS